MIKAITFLLLTMPRAAELSYAYKRAALAEDHEFSSPSSEPPAKRARPQPDPTLPSTSAGADELTGKLISILQFF